MAGQVASPLDTSNAQTDKNKLGLALEAPIMDAGSGLLGGIDENTKEIDGSVNSDATVYLYDIEPTTPVLITTAKPNKNGAFSVKLPKVLFGKKLQLKVVDIAENVYTLDMDSDISLLDLNPVLVNPVTNYASDITITFTDPNKLMTALSTEVTYDDGINGFQVLNSSKYTLTAGSKLVIKAGTLDVGTYTIKLTNGAFDDNKSCVTGLVIGFGDATSKSASSLTVSAAASTASGAIAGDTKLKVTPATGNVIKYLISNLLIVSPKMGVDASAIPLISLLDTTTMVVSGVDVIDNKYLGVYEVTPGGAVAKYTLITITASMVKSDLSPPALSGVDISSDNKSMTLTFDQAIFKAGTATIKNSVKISTDGITFKALGASDTVAISAPLPPATTTTTVVVNFGSALSSSNNKIQISAGILQNKYGRTNALITTSGMDLRALGAGLTGTVTNNTTETNIVTGGKTIVLTLSKATWLAADGTDNTFNNDYKSGTIDSLFDGMVADGSQGAEWGKVVTDLKAGKSGTDINAVKRTSNTVLTITLPAETTFDISANQNISVTIPKALVIDTLGVTSSVDVLASPTFRISIASATAALSGTVTSSTEADITTGAETIILTLSNGTWAPYDGSASTYYKDATALTLINGMTASGSEGSQWKKVKDALVATTGVTGNTAIVRTSPTVLTITLPVVPSYDIIANQVIKVTIPRALVTGATATVIVSPTTFSISKV